MRNNIIISGIGVIIGIFVFSIVPVFPAAILVLLVGIVVLIMVLLRISFPLLLLLALMVSALFFNIFDVGPVSPKNYLVLVLSALLIGSVAVTRKNPLRTKEASKLFFIYLCFILWIVFNKAINGESINSIVYLLFGRHFSAIAIFVAIQYYLKSGRDITIMSAFMGITVLLSVCVGIMQYYDVSLGWTIRSILYPETNMRLLYSTHAIVDFDIKDVGSVPGLSLSSISFTYQIATFGMMLIAWTYFLLQERISLRLILGISAVSVFLAGLLLGQSRSAFFGVIIGVFFLIRYSKYVHIVISKRAKNNVKKFVFGGLMLIIVVSTFYHLNKSEQTLYSKRNRVSQLGRVFDLRDSQRIAIAKKSIEFFLENPFLGNLSKFMRGSLFAPHNLFLNAAVCYGIIGLLLIILLVKVVFSTCIKAVKLSAKRHSITWITFGAVTGIVAEFFNSQFHNSNFVAGSHLPWWLLGILCVIIDSKQKPSLNHEAKDSTKKRQENLASNFLH